MHTKRSCGRLGFVVSVMAVFVLMGTLSSGCKTDFSKGKDTGDGGGVDSGALCGDGLVGEGEGCDDGNTTAGDGCDESCAVEPGWSCQGEPSVCSQSCGDGVLQEGEECDGEDLGGETCESIPGGFSEGTLSCKTDCTFDTANCVLPGCGDGVQDFGEECDDGNDINTDGCLNNCRLAICGDGYVYEGQEECDDGNAINTDACLSTCVQASCGDGYVQAGVEQCDDGNDINTDSCPNNCAPATCGDGIVQEGVEECDDGNDDNTDACLNTCIQASCGDGFLQAGVEECDDGNGSNSDACLNNCVPASCGDGYVRSGVEECDDGNGSNSDACLNNCAQASCGDGYVRSGVEQCDDGNGSNTDACLNSCVQASCGDGYTWSGHEQCDDGDNSNTDYCLNSCVQASCGDGYVRSGVEDCDDGGTVAGDGCSPSCEDENLPVLHWIASNAQGWNQETITYAGDAHAPTTDIIAAANVQARDQIYFFTRTTYHLMSIPGRTWTAHGSLSSRFDDLPTATYHAAYGVSWETDNESSILFFNGSQYYLYYIVNSSGYVYDDGTNPGTIPWNTSDPFVPNSSNVVASYIALENDEGWVGCSPFQLCGSGGSTTGPYGAFFTSLNRIHIQETGSCFEFCSEVVASSFEPFSLSGAPTTTDIQAMAYGDGVLYVVTQE